MTKYMKHYLFFALLCSLPVLTAAQSGNGSSSTPFYGDISTNVIWTSGAFNNDEIYIGTSGNPNLRVVSGGKLTIEKGLKIIFTQSNSNLIVTSSGILNVTGTSDDPVLFTKHPLNSKWGHVSFETPGSATPITGTGSFEYAVFEYGYAATSGTNPDNAGGALQINAKDVVIDHCTFRHNYSNFGGAVTVNAGTDRNTIIRNTYFHNNTANQAGGALLTWTGSTPVVENCIFESNHCNGIGNAQYSGGAIWVLQNTSKIVNCTFVENTSARDGDAIYSYISSNMRIINSILWGSDDQFAGAYTTSTINYCAFETSRPANASNSIIISSTASDHFTDAGNSDWSLKLLSPCRDAGANSLTGITIPTTDYLGNSTVFNKDLGAYEVQYSRWKTTAPSTDWTTVANWDGGIPTSIRDVIVPTGATNYPTGSPTQDFTIGAGKQMILEHGARVTLNDLTNNGTIKLNDNNSGFASLILNSYLKGTGANEKIQLFLSGGGTKAPLTYKWHYISSPVTTLATSVFTATTPDLAQFVESRPSTDPSEGWVAYDGYIYSTGNMTGPTFSSLSPGKGYNYFDVADHTFTFSGMFNTSDITVNLNFTNTAPIAYKGYNLLGNPFPSGLDWNYIITHSFPASTSKSVYFTRNSVWCTYINGVGVPSDVSGIIPPMQGFFTKTSSIGGATLTLAAAARVHDNIHARYKGEKTIIPLIRLALSESAVETDETVVRFDEEAKSYLDYDFDAVKIFLSPDLSSIYTSLVGTNYTINGLPFPEINEVTEIPVIVNLTSTGTHKITASQLQGLESYSVTLKDNTTGFIADLKKTSEITFAAAAGTISDRFILSVGANIITGLETPVSGQGDFTIYHSDSYLNILPNSELWNNAAGSLRIIDISGKTVYDSFSINIAKDELIRTKAPGKQGLYFIEISSGMKRYVGKVMVK